MPNLADAWLHNLDPFAIDLSGTFIGDLINGGIRWYGLSYLAGFVIGFLLIRRVLKAGVSPLKPVQAADLVITVAIAIVIGGRLGYVLFYKPDLLIDFSGSLPFWGVLAINKGGMASHGGMLGGIGGCAFFAWRYRVGTAHLLDLMAFGAPLGLLMGRIANFINGELYGRRCEPDSPLYPIAVKFPQEIYDDFDGEHWQGERINEVVALANEQGKQFPDGREYVDYAIGQARQGNADWIAFMNEHITARYPSQLFAGLTEGIVVFAVLLILYRKPVKTGLIGGWFCVTYALMRILNERYRLPDQHLMEDGVIPTITRGQVLSFGLLVLGVVTIVLAMRSKGDKLGGWMKGKGSAPDANG